jgi:multifunctional beta-oxidation protein
MQANFGKAGSASVWGSNYDAQDSDLVRKAKLVGMSSSETTYDERDAILYNLGLGATEKELHYVFEEDAGFTLVPSYGVIPLATAYRKLPRRSFVSSRRLD